MVFRRRRTAASLPAARAQGEAGLADAVVASIAVYEAAVFSLTPDGVSEDEQKARLDRGLPARRARGFPQRGPRCGGRGPEAIDAGRDRDRARATVAALALTAHDCRAPRATRQVRPPGRAEHDPLTGP